MLQARVAPRRTKIGIPFHGFASSWGLCLRPGNEAGARACLGRWSFLCPAAGRIQSKATLWKFISYAANNYSCPDQTRKSFPSRVKLANNSTYKGESTWERASGNAGVTPEPELLVLSEPPATSVWTSQSQLKARGWKQFNLICKPAETLAAQTANPDGAVLLLPGVTATAINYDKTIKIQEKTYIKPRLSRYHTLGDGEQCHWT